MAGLGDWRSDEGECSEGSDGCDIMEVANEFRNLICSVQTNIVWANTRTGDVNVRWGVNNIVTVFGKDQRACAALLAGEVAGYSIVVSKI